MAKETRRRVAFAATVLILGSLALFSCARFMGDEAMSEEEDRPPIIVRGGSLHFISGDVGSGVPDERDGKPWIHEERTENNWQPDHKKGKKTKWFVLEFDPNTMTCPATVIATKLTVYYGTSTFVIEAKPRHGGGGNAPNIFGTGLKPSGSTQNPELVLDGGDGKITKVEYDTRKDGTKTCESPTKVTIWQ